MSHKARTIRKVSQILGYSISDISGVREFAVIDGTIYTDVFTGDVTIADYTGTIKKAFNGKIGATDYYNEIILDRPSRCLKTVSLDLEWGSESLFCEIKDLLDELDADFSLDDSGVSSKKIEDFTISLKTADEASNDKAMILNDEFSFYIRRPLIVSVSKENRHDERYF